jgi:hypothetical protein
LRACQLDPLEARCAEIRDLLRGAEPLVDSKDISGYITRDIVHRCGKQVMSVTHAWEIRITGHHTT